MKDSFEQSINFFWSATLPQIYRTLNQMENQGWLRAETVIQMGKPNRKVYHITEEGAGELHRWLNEPMEAVELRNPTLIKVFFGSGADPDRFAANLKELQAYHTEQLNRFEVQGTEIIQREAEKFQCPTEGVYWDLARDFGVRWARMVTEWCENALKTHEKTRGLNQSVQEEHL